AEVLLEGGVQQHGAIAKEIQLFGTIARQAQQLADGQARAQQARRKRQQGLAQAARDLRQRQRAVAGEVEAAAAARAQRVQDRAGDVLVPDEDEGAVAAAHGQQAGLLEQ